MELSYSSESILSEALVTGVAGRSMGVVSGVCFLRGGPCALASWPSASEAFRLRAVGGVVIGIGPVPPDDGTSSGCGERYRRGWHHRAGTQDSGGAREEGSRTGEGGGGVREGMAVGQRVRQSPGFKSI